MKNLCGAFHFVKGTFQVLRTEDRKLVLSGKTATIHSSSTDNTDDADSLFLLPYRTEWQ